MEDLDRQERKRKFFEFVGSTEERVSDIGARKGSTVRSAQAVTRRLFEATGGDAGKVTDEDIAKAFDEVDKTD